MEKAQFGMVGLGTMGRNFLLNVADKGFSCVGYDLDESKRQLLMQEGAGKAVEAASSVAEFVGKLAAPRNIMLLVPAGKIVDAVINDLLPHLSAGDIIIEGGNSHFTDTERREAFLAESGVEFIGVGVSGGEEGARHGASIMPGGKREFYERIAPILETVAARVENEPCVAYMGGSSAGHFVKMVHNGIEYGLMQILAETYDFLHRVLKMDYAQMSKIFAEWNAAELNSFLVEITADVLKFNDVETGKPLVEMILDKAGQKGTGKWTSQAAMDFGVPIPTIDSAVSMRQISAQKETRLIAAQIYCTQHKTQTKSGDGASIDVVSVPQPSDAKHIRAQAEAETAASLNIEAHSANISAECNGESLSNTDFDRQFDENFADDAERLIGAMKNALLASFIVTYAQGMSLLQQASIEKNYELNLAEIAKIWRGGCIIRSSLLEQMRVAYSENPQLPNMILDRRFVEIINRCRQDWREVVEIFSASRIPALCLSSALQYFDAFVSERLPANLIQAQRDFFGAHLYQRIDKEGTFHTEWKG